MHGRSTAVGYWQRREQTAEKMRGPWFASGDRYRRDDDGRYWHIGRADDMFKVAGEWCSATEVEAALAAHPAVAECAVVPHPDADGVLKPRAVVVLASGVAGGDALADALRAFVRGRLAHYKCPRTIDFVADLPKTATGKIQRFKLRDRSRAQHDTHLWWLVAPSRLEQRHRRRDRAACAAPGRWPCPRSSAPRG